MAEKNEPGDRNRPLLTLFTQHGPLLLYIPSSPQGWTELQGLARLTPV